MTTLLVCTIIGNSIGAFAITEYEYDGEENIDTINKLTEGNIEPDSMSESREAQKQEVSINVSDTKTFINKPLDPKEMIISATDEDGLPIPYDEIEISGSQNIDFTKFGIYKIGFSYKDSPEVFAILTVSEGAQIVALKDTYTGLVGLEIRKDHLVSIVKSISGTTINYDDVKIDGKNEYGQEINLNNPSEGLYDITATYEDVNTTFRIIIQTETKAELVLREYEKDVDLSERSVIDKLVSDPLSFVSSMKDVDGSEMTVTPNVIKVTTNLKKDEPNIGEYFIKYQGSNGITQTMTIHLTSKYIKLEVQDATLKLGGPFERNMVLTSAINADGKNMNVNDSNIKQEGTVNTGAPGKYTITFKYRGVEATAIVTVEEDESNQFILDENKLTRYQNDRWNHEELVGGGSYQGEAIDKKNVTYEYDQSKVDTIGEFILILSYKEMKKEVTITVLEDVSSIEGISDVETYSGLYTEMYGHIKFHTPDGRTINGTSMFYGPENQTQYNAQVTAKLIEGNVTTSTWPVNYFVGQQGIVEYTITYRNKIAGSFKLTVNKDQKQVTTKNSKLVINEDTWSLYDNVESVTDYKGDPVDFTKLDVEGTVPTDSNNYVNKIGRYKVKYIYTPSYPNNKAVSSTSEINVINSAAEINMRDITVYHGETWDVRDHFVSGLTNKGELLTKEDIGNGDNDLVKYTIKNSEGKFVDNVDTQNNGIYTITYSYSTVKVEASLRVVTFEPTINAHDSSVYVNSSWVPEDNFDGGYAANGKRLSIEDIKVNPSKIDTTSPSVTKVSYVYKDVIKTISVTVKERALSINVHDLKIPIKSEWTPEDNFDSASNSNGDEVSFNDLDVTIRNSKNEKINEVDTSKIDNYTITYLYEEEPGVSVESEAKLTVYSLAELQLADKVTIPIYEDWDPAVAFIGARTPDGKIIKDWKDIEDDIEIIGEVDTSRIGTYDVVYKYENISQEVQVKIDATKLISVTIPVEIVFGTKDSDKEIESKKYEIKNNSDEVVTKVSLENFTKDKSSTRLLESDDPDPIAIENAARINLITSENMLISSLTEKTKNKDLVTLNPKTTEEFEINGKYFGDISNTEIVKYNMRLKFAHSYE